MTAEMRDRLVVASHLRGRNAVLRPLGVLNTLTYLHLRDSIIKAAVDEPRSIVIDVDGLDVPVASAWAVFTSARWHIRQWLDLPITLVCSSAQMREAVKRSGVTRYLPLFDDVAAAIAAVDVGNHPHRRRVRKDFAGGSGDVDRAREYATRTLREWQMPELLPVASTVAGLLVENARTHGGGVGSLRLESLDGLLTVAVADHSSRLALRHEQAERPRPSGLDIIATVCRRWGNSPTEDGKIVWACIGPENRLTAIARLL